MASSARVRAILELVSELSEAEREELRDELDASPEQWNSAWNDELSRRVAQIESGDVQCATLDEVAKRMLNRD